MCGPINSILGRSIEPIVSRFISNMPAPFPVAAGEVRLRGALIEIDETSGRAVRIQRVDEAGPARTAALEPEARIDLEASAASEEA
jgi:calcineurin-like phosphoesterase